jgi:lipopolysaccharide export system permease protein
LYLTVNIVPEGSNLKESNNLKERNNANSNQAAMIAELAWRLGMPLLVPIIVCLAIPLSRVNPRQGRFMHILPSILIYLAYLVLLSSVKRAQESGSLPVWANVWWVHLLFALLALMLFCGDAIKRWRLKL